MHKWSWAILVVCGIGLLAGSARTAGSSALQTAPAQAANPEFLTRNCVACHNQRLKTAGLALDAADMTQVAADARHVGKGRAEAAHRLDAASRRPRPDAAATLAFVAGLESALDRAAAREREPGPSRRASPEPRGVRQRDPRSLRHRGRRPNAASGRRCRRARLRQHRRCAVGFAGAPGSVHVGARRKSRVRRWDGRCPARRSRPTTFPRLLMQNTRLSEDLPFGSRGGIAVRHAFPVDGEYSIKIKLQTNLYDYIRGLGRPHRLEVRLDGVRVAQFMVGGEDHGSPAPASFAGAIFGSPEWEKYAHDADANLEARFTANAGTRRRRRDVRRRVERRRRKACCSRVRCRIRWRSTKCCWAMRPSRTSRSAGPMPSGSAGDTPSRRRILTCTPSIGRQGTGMRQIDPVDARAPRISPSSHRRRCRRAADLLRRGPPRRRG